MTKVVRNTNTGRFEKVADTEPKTENVVRDVAEDPSPAVNMASSISETVSVVLAGTEELERNLNRLGVVYGTPFASSRDPEAECADDEDGDNIFALPLRNVLSRLNSENSCSNRPYNVVRESVLNSLIALTFVTVRGAYTFNGDGGNVEILANLTERDLTGYSGLYDVQEFFNELATHTRESLNSLSCSLLGQGTEHFDGEDTVNFETINSANLRDHLSGVNDVLRTIQAHLAWLNNQIALNLL